MNIKEKLLKLFEYQEFEKNSRLDEIINDVLSDEMCELSDDALLAAAGGYGESKHKKGDIVIIKSGRYANETGKIVDVSFASYKIEIEHLELAERFLVEVPFSDVDD